MIFFLKHIKFLFFKHLKEIQKIIYLFSEGKGASGVARGDYDNRSSPPISIETYWDWF